MRGWPSWKTISTPVVANTAPSATMPAAQFIPSAENAVASGCAVAEFDVRHHPGQDDATRM